MIFGHFFKQKKKKKKEKKKHKERIIKNKIIRDIIEQEKNCYELKRKSNFLIEYEGNGKKTRNLSLDEYLNKTELFLRVQ